MTFELYQHRTRIDGREPDLDNQQLDRLTKQIESMKEVLAKSNDTTGKILEDVPQISDAYKNNFELKKVELTSAIAALELATSTKKGKVGVLLASSKTAIAALKAAGVKVASQLKDLRDVGIVAANRAG